MIRFSLRSPLVLVLLLIFAALSLWTYKYHDVDALPYDHAGSLPTLQAQKDATAGSALPKVKPESRKTRRLMPEEAYRHQDGLLYLTDIAKPGVILDNVVEHPISYLAREAKRKWEAKLARRSKTLVEAADTYRRKYKRAPPRGFDKWFQFAKDNKVILVDDYDQINRDMLPLLGLPSRPLQDRSRTMIEDKTNYYYQGSFTMHVKDGAVAQVTGGKKDHSRRKEQESLIAGFVHLLPDMNITIWIDDGPVMHVTGEKRQELEGLASLGETLSEDRWGDWGDPPEFTGWEAFCLPDSPMRAATAGLADRALIPAPSFIEEHYPATDFCLHPANLPLHSLTNNYGIGPRAVNIHPLFSHCKTSLYADIVVTPLEQYDASVGQDVEWANKRHNKILWRGSVTGSRYDRGIVWRSTQRVRLTALANSQSKEIQKTVFTTAADNETLVAIDASLAALSHRYFDIAFTGKPIACREDDGTCQAMSTHLHWAKSSFMSNEEANQYRYVMDVDGNGWSGRFHRLMSSNAAVLKSQGYTEWWGDRIQPWLHYIPVKLDYSDLHSIASYFVGDATSSGHGSLGKEIGQAGKEWAEKHWRMEDMQAYMFRLYLEYARVMGRSEDDPRSMDYVG